MRYLGIDYGTRDVGLAISDGAGRFAFPLKVVKNDSRLPELIADIAKQEEVEEIIMGESLNFDGKNNPVMAGINRLKDTLTQEFHLTVTLEPEWMTSQEVARDEIKDELSHARAAAIILRNYLERKNYHA